MGVAHAAARPGSSIGQKSIPAGIACRSGPVERGVAGGMKAKYPIPRRPIAAVWDPSIEVQPVPPAARGGCTPPEAVLRSCIIVACRSSPDKCLCARQLVRGPILHRRKHRGVNYFTPLSGRRMIGSRMYARASQHGGLLS